MSSPFIPTELMAKYPFTPSSKAFFERVDIAESFESEAVRAQAEKRLRCSVARGRYDPHPEPLIEFPSFFVAALVASRENYLGRKFSEYESLSARNTFTREAATDKSGIIKACFGITFAEPEMPGSTRTFVIPVMDYLAAITRFELNREQRWRLVNQPMDKGIVYLTENDIDDFFAGLAEKLVHEGVKNLSKVPFPAQLAAIRDGILPLLPPPRPNSGKGYLWVEELLANPTADGRHRWIWLVLAPYCFPPSTFILGDNRTIGELKVGGHAQGIEEDGEITTTFRCRYEGRMVAVQGSGLLPFEATPEHPVLVSEARSVGYSTPERFGEPRWKTTGELVPVKAGVGDYLILPRIPGKIEDCELDFEPYIARMKKPWLNKTHNITLDRELAWLLGIYVAEGSATPHNRSIEVVFTLNINESEFAEKIKMALTKLGCNAHIHCMPNANNRKVTVSSVALGSALHDWCGNHAEFKRVPEFILYHNDPEIMQSFLDGYLHGDGSILKGTGGRYPHDLIEGGTVSITLALQLQLLFARLGKFLALYPRRSLTSTIKGRLTTGRPSYIFGYRPDAVRRRVRILPERLLVPVSRVSARFFEGDVCNIETNDNTYLVSNIVVHNCINVKHMDQQDAIDKITAFVNAKGSSRPMKTYIQGQVKRCVRNGLMPPTLMKLKTVHPDLYALLPKTVTEFKGGARK